MQIPFNKYETAKTQMIVRHYLICSLLCASYAFAAGKNQIVSLSIIRKLVPGQVTKEVLTKRFGKPDEVLDFKKIPSSKLIGEEWIYKQNGRNRVTFTFTETSDSLDSWVWLLHEGEPEKDLIAAKKKFQSIEWQVQTEKWINPSRFSDGMLLQG